jgi:hypothetical protein
MSERWTRGTGLWRLRLAKGFIDATVRPFAGGGGHYVSVNRFRINSKRYETVEAAMADAERYVMRKLREALAEMEAR